MASGPEIIDVHLHLCRDVNQERLVFPKDGWPDEWYWGNPDAVIPYMNERGVSYVATQNIMDTGRMTEARLARVRAGGASDEEVERVRLDLAEQMRERVRGFNDWACETHAEEPRIIPFVMIDPVLFGEAADRGAGPLHCERGEGRQGPPEHLPAHAGPPEHAGGLRAAAGGGAADPHGQHLASDERRSSTGCRSTGVRCSRGSRG